MKVKEITETGLYKVNNIIYECFEYEEEPLAFSEYVLNEVLYSHTGEKIYENVGEIIHFNQFNNEEFKKLDENKYEVRRSYIKEL